MIVFLSVIFPNNLVYFNDFLDSLNRQTFKEFSLILFNDGCEIEILKKYLNHFNIKFNIINVNSISPVQIRNLMINYVIENDITLWELSQTKTPFSKEIVKNYLETSQGDIKERKQLRLVITSLSNESLGFIDLFDFDAQNNRAGVSIVITAAHRNKGFGKDALKVLMEHSFKTLALHQLYSNILEENTASLRLFESVGFQNVGQKKEWRFFNGSYKNEYLLQYINHVL